MRNLDLSVVLREELPEMVVFYVYRNYASLVLIFLAKIILARESLKFGFISPTDGPYGYVTSAAATTMAIEKAKKDGLWQDVDVK